MPDTIIYKTKIHYLRMVLFWVVIFHLFLILENLRNSQNFIQDVLTIYSKNNLSIVAIGIGVSVVFIVPILATISLTDKELIINYPLRPFWNNYSFNLDEISNVKLLPAVGKGSSDTITLAFKDGKKIKSFGHQTGSKSMRILAEYLRGVNIPVDCEY